MKRQMCADDADNSAMPPTRGHDLKLLAASSAGSFAPDAPHTGARLETYPE